MTADHEEQKKVAELEVSYSQQDWPQVLAYLSPRMPIVPIVPKQTAL